MLAPSWVVMDAAHADESVYQAFYTPPDPLPVDLNPGDVIRTEPSRLVFEPSGQLADFQAAGTRVMYVSSDNNDAPIAVTGTYFEPDAPWPHTGPRPLIAFAPDVYGIGDQCAASRLFNQGIHYGGGADITVGYEQAFVGTLVRRGFAVVVTDYQGVGTPSSPTAFVRKPAAHALIDSARAATRLAGTSMSAATPVAFWGHGQGGQASAAAAELAASYGPDVNLVGTFAGAPAADLTLIPPYADGSIFAGGLGYLLNGIGAAYPDLAQGLAGALTPAGHNLLARTANDCVGELALRFGFRHIDQYFTADPLEFIRTEPLKSVLDQQRVGTLTPNAPVFIQSNRYDPFIPYAGARQLALDWCAKGADVEFHTNEQPPLFNKTAINNLLPYFVDGERVIAWLTDRFNRVPTMPNCAQAQE